MASCLGNNMNLNLPLKKYEGFFYCPSLEKLSHKVLGLQISKRLK